MIKCNWPGQAKATLPNVTQDRELTLSCQLQEFQVADGEYVRARLSFCTIRGSLLFFDSQRYHLLAWVVMPNHVHVLFQPMSDWSVAKIVASWKKFTARKICDYLRNATLQSGSLKSANQEISVPRANQEIGVSRVNLSIGVPRVPPVWHREYWDRFIRDNNHFQQAVEYIHQNPVKARLVEKAEDWPWSSARFSKGCACGHEFANREIGVPGGSS